MQIVNLHICMSAEKDVRSKLEVAYTGVENRNFDILARETLLVEFIDLNHDMLGIGRIVVAVGNR